MFVSARSWLLAQSWWRLRTAARARRTRMLWAFWGLSAWILYAASGEEAEGRSLQMVVPNCRPGYRDVSDGQAYPWSCAFHCPGGAFATATCQCACLNDEQIERYEEQGIEIQSGNVSGQAERPITEILVPQPPDPTLAPSDPVQEMPEGNLEPRERLTPPSSFLAPGSPTLSKTGDSEEAGDGTVGTIFAVIGGVVFVGASLVMVGTAFRHACFRAMDPSQSPKPKAPKAPKGPSPGVPRPRPLDPKIAPPASRPVAMWSLDEAMKPPNVADRWKLLKSQRVLPRDSRSTSAETPPRQSSVLEQSTEPIDNPDATPARFSKQLS